MAQNCNGNKHGAKKSTVNIYDQTLGAGEGGMGEGTAIVCQRCESASHAKELSFSEPSIHPSEGKDKYLSCHPLNELFGSFKHLLEIFLFQIKRERKRKRERK